jgi:3-oxoacyl-[acyl-carrier protein] reductase
MNLKDAKVLVTGGTSGIGYETAKMMIEQGAKAAICGRHKDTVEKSAKELGAEGIIADVSKEEDVINMVKTTIKKLGNINVLINNAAFGYFSLLKDMDTKKFNEMYSANVTGAMMVGRECAKHFIENNYGNIVNIASTAGLHGYAGGTAYSSSKFALRGMTECWRAELRKNNIRVMLVNPSEVQTNFGSNAGREKRAMNPSKLEAQEIAHTICSMLSMNDKGFITEATIFATNPQS